MMNRSVKVAETFSVRLGFFAALLTLALIAVTLVEVFCRYVLVAPTLWAFDVAYMLNGAAFLLAAASTQVARQHVAIDVFSAQLPKRVQGLLQGSAFVFLVVPALGWLSYAAGTQAWSAWQTGEVDRLSAWRPEMWPFRTAVALGLTALTLQVFFDGLGRLFGFETEET